jgi:hypothetical protein
MIFMPLACARSADGSVLELLSVLIFQGPHEGVSGERHCREHEANEGSFHAILRCC